MASVFEKKLNRLRLICGANLVLRHTGRVLSAAGAAAVLVVLAERLLALNLTNLWTFWAFGGAAAGVIFLLWLFDLPSKMQASLLLDERLKLHERFSTVLLLSGFEDPFAKAACDEARIIAERVNLQKHFPVRLSRCWIYAVGVWLITGALVVFMPQKDLLGFMRKHQQQQQQVQRVQQAKVEVRDAAEPVKLAVQQLGDEDLADALSKLESAEGLPKNAEPQDIKRQAIRTLGELSEQIRKMHGGKSPADSVNLMQQMFRQLPGSVDTFSQTLRQALAKGNFGQASSALNQLQKQLAQGELSEQQRKLLAEQLQDLAKQLQELAQKNEAFEKELEKLGLDKSLANLSDKKLREALGKLGLSADKIDQLLQKASESQMACSRCAALGQALAACGAGVSGLSADELAAAMEQLDELEAIKQQLMLAQASLDEISRAIACLGKGMCDGPGMQGPFMEGLSQGTGPGTGGPGIGYGPRGTTQTAETATQKTRVINKPGEGPAIASWYFKDSQTLNQAKRDFSEVIAAARDGAAEAISENQVPRKYEEAVKKYFSQLEQSGSK